MSDNPSPLVRSSRAGCTVCIRKRYPVTVNDPQLTSMMLPTLRRVAGDGQLHLVPKTYEPTLLSDGTALLTQATFDTPPDGAEIYAPATGTFTAIGRTLGFHAYGAAAVRLADGSVPITGGQTSRGAGGTGDANAERFLPATRTFVSAGSMTTGRAMHSATLLPDGSVLIAGGLTIWGAAPTLTSSAEIYRPSP